MASRLVIRHFFWASDPALPRLWPFHDLMASRGDVEYHLHLVGGYPGPTADVQERSYVTSRFRLPRARRGSETWLIRGWNRPQLVWRAWSARARRVPIVMWAERPGFTYDASTWERRLRIWVREQTLPVLFRPYRRRALLLGTGPLAVERFRSLAPGGAVALFPYPDHIADALLAADERRRRPDVPRLLFVGRFEHEKATDLIERACDRLWAEGMSFRVRYVGSGSRLPAIEAHVEANPGRVERCDFATGDTLLAHFAQSDVLLLPSRRDGWGLPIHEGLASGMAVVASDACGASALIEDGRCGVVVRAGDVEDLQRGIRSAIRMVDEDGDRLRRDGRSIAENMTMPHLADELVRHCSALVHEDDQR